MSTTKFESRVIKCATDVVLAYQDHKRALDDNSGIDVQARYLRKLNTSLTTLDVSLGALDRDNTKKSQTKARANQRRHEESERVSAKSVDYSSTFKTVFDIIGFVSKGRRSANIVEGEIVD